MSVVVAPSENIDPRTRVESTANQRNSAHRGPQPAGSFGFRCPSLSPDIAFPPSRFSTCRLQQLFHRCTHVHTDATPGELVEFIQRRTKLKAANKMPTFRGTHSKILWSWRLQPTKQPKRILSPWKLDRLKQAFSANPSWLGE